MEDVETCTDELGDEESVSAGESINAFREDAGKVGLAPPKDWLFTCQNQAVMCCWPRDRQCGDNNGNCETNGCKDSDPADNTNLCFMERDKDFTKLDHVAAERGTLDIFPGESEGDMHCHGFAWSDNMEDGMTKYIGNNFFYVSMYDHLYTRGYVNNIPSQEMCGCIEEMAPMSRSDCTELAVTEKIGIKIGKEGIEKVYKFPDIEFNACTGSPKNNDLYSYAYKLYSQRKLSLDKLNKIREHLFGWRGQGNEEESACFTHGIQKYYEEK